MAAVAPKQPLSAIPLFPLPNVVLFPYAVLPLHIFETRYREMTTDVLASDGQLAMALLRPGWEKDYDGVPEIEPVVCVGTVVRHERLPDQHYNILLQGHTRARIASESRRGAYRVAELEPIAETGVPESRLGPLRGRLMHVFDDGTLLATVIGRQFRQLLGSDLPTPDIADLIAFNFLDDVSLKQQLLADADVLRRVERIVMAFESLYLPPIAAPARTSGPSLN